MSLRRFIFMQSAMLAECEYDDASKELSVTFKNGRTYTYVDVPVDLYLNLIDAKSAGSYFNSIKKGLKLK